MASRNRHRTITPTSPSPSPPPSPPPRQSIAALPDASANPASSHQHRPFPQLPQPDPPCEAIPQHVLARANLEGKVRAIVDNLYQIAVVAAETQQGSENLVAHKVNETVHALAQLDAAKMDIMALIPQDVIEMLDAGRNPDIHTRNFVSRLAAEKQYSYGQHGAMQEYNSKLTAALDEAFPALATDPSKESAL